MLGYEKTNSLKDDIMNITKLLMKEYGYEKTTFQMISDELGITKGTITYYFKNKHLIAAEIIEEFFSEIKQYIKENLEEENNAYLSYCILYMYVYREIFKHQKNLQVFYNRKQIDQWSDHIFLLVAENYKEIAKNFHRQTTEEQCRINALIDLGARVFMYN